MTFKKTPPTMPGFYAWRSDPSGKPMALTVQKWIRGLIVFHHPDLQPPLASELGGEWCRLVPAEEIEKAYLEGMEDWTDADESTHLWHNSRARRVMEGKE